MVINSNLNHYLVSRNAALAEPVLSPALAPQRDAETRAYGDTALISAQAMASAPSGPSPLATIPTSWFPMGQQNRSYGAYLGGVPIPRTSGTAQVNRSDDQFSLTSPHGNFTMTRDQDNPGRVQVSTPQGDYNGTLRTGPNGQVIFDAGDSRTVTMQRVTPRLFGSPYVEISASGFGLPVGSLRVH